MARPSRIALSTRDLTILPILHEQIVAHSRAFCRHASRCHRASGTGPRQQALRRWRKADQWVRASSRQQTGGQGGADD